MPVQGSRSSGMAEFLKRPADPLDLPLGPPIDLRARARPQRRRGLGELTAVLKPDVPVLGDLGREGPVPARLVVNQTVPCPQPPLLQKGHQVTCSPRFPSVRLAQEQSPEDLVRARFHERPGRALQSRVDLVIDLDAVRHYGSPSDWYLQNVQLSYAFDRTSATAP